MVKEAQEKMPEFNFSIRKTQGYSSGRKNTIGKYYIQSTTMRITVFYNCIA